MSEDALEKALKRITKLEGLQEEKANELKRKTREITKLSKELQLEQDALKLIADERHKGQAIPTWVSKPVKTKQHHATPIQMWADFHFGEVQPAHEVGGFNAYSDKIAEMRLRHVTESSIKLLTEYTSGVRMDGIVIAGAGDYITGAIHDELTKTNSETVFETVVRWVGPMAAAIEAYADAFGKVFVPMVQGNHDRNTHKVESKRGPQECISWVLCWWLADRFKDDPRVDFYIGESWDISFKVYDSSFILTHGYGTPGGGPASAVAAMMKLKSQYDIRDNAVGNKSTHLLMGHLHQVLHAPGATMGGCLKGVDAYAWGLRVKPVAPQQALLQVTPERGITTRWDVDAEAPGERKLWPKVQYGRNV